PPASGGAAGDRQGVEAVGRRDRLAGPRGALHFPEGERTAMRPNGQASAPLPEPQAGSGAYRGGLKVWLPVCLVLVAGMGFLRLVVYPDTIVPLTYALPLLVCLWHRDLRLLWGMAGVFVVLVVAKMSRLSTQNALSVDSEFVFGVM